MAGAGVGNTANKLIEELFYKIQKHEQCFLTDELFPDLTISEVHTLSSIGSCSSPTISKISSCLDVTLSTITITVNRLVKKGYIKKEKQSSDRRKVYLWLTEKGKKVYRYHKNFHRRIESLIAQRMQSEEYMYFKNSLEHLKEFLTVNQLNIKE